MSLNHVCGVHKTSLNECEHDEGEGQPADQPPLLTYGSAAHNALKEVVFSDKLRRKLQYLVRYR